MAFETSILTTAKGEFKLTINEMQEINAKRAERWHKGNIKEWNALEWAGAMCGEAGEAANAAKKLRRLELGIASINSDHMEDAVSELHGVTTERRHFTDIETAKLAVAKEVADTIIYGLILISYCVDAECILRDVFNKKSEEYGFPERLA